MARTQTEIIDRIETITGDDMWGFRREVLVDSLDYVHAKHHLNKDVTETDWNNRSVAAHGVDTIAVQYLEFAIDKIDNHRGLSASRSVDKLTEYAWLLGRDDIVEAMHAADYAQYGAPKIIAFAKGMDWHYINTPELDNMAHGRPCIPGCNRGCDQ